MNTTAIKVRIPLFLALCSVIVATAIVLALTFGTRSSSHLKTESLLRTFDKYQREGLLNSPLLQLNKWKFTIPHYYVEIRGERTFGEVTADVRDIMAERGQLIADLADTVSFSEFVTHIAHAFLRGSRLEGKSTINSVPEEDHLNIVFLERDPGMVSSFFDHATCTYLGEMNLIVCNAGRIASLLDKLSGINENYSVAMSVFDKGNADSFTVNFATNLDVLQQYLQQNLLTWIIGHEIGHALLHNDWVEEKRLGLHFSVQYNDMEREADAFVSQIVLSDVPIGANFSTMLLEYIEHEFREEHFRQRGEYSNIDPANNLPPEPLIFDASSGDPPPLVLRAVRVMRELLVADPAVLDRAHYTEIGGFISYVHSIKPTHEYVNFLESRMKIVGENESDMPVVIIGGVAGFCGMCVAIVLGVRRKGGRNAKAAAQEVES